MESKTIAVCITTHNRYDTFKNSYEHWVRYLPKDAVIFVVDDASDYPVPEANFRFNDNVGISKAKNKCLSLAKDYEHIFLADDDIYPINGDWHLPFINSGERHLQLSFQFNMLGQRYSNNVFITSQDKDLNVFNAPNGCLYYFHNDCLKVIGGYDERYTGYAGEHQDISQRIFNAGLTTHPFATPYNAFADFHISDFYGIESSVPLNVRVGNINRNMERIRANINSKEFIPYE